MAVKELSVKINRSLICGGQTERRRSADICWEKCNETLSFSELIMSVHLKQSDIMWLSPESCQSWRKWKYKLSGWKEIFNMTANVKIKDVMSSSFELNNKISFRPGSSGFQLFLWRCSECICVVLIRSIVSLLMNKKRWCVWTWHRHTADCNVKLKVEQTGATRTTISTIFLSNKIFDVLRFYVFCSQLMKVEQKLP